MSYFFFLTQVDNQFYQKGFSVLYSEKYRALSKVKSKARQTKWPFGDWSCLNIGCTWLIINKTFTFFNQCICTKIKSHI